jgi:hypothetical protein
VSVNASTTGGTLFDVLDAGPARANPLEVTWHNGAPIVTYVGSGNVITAVPPTGMYKEAMNPASNIFWGEEEPCSLVSTLLSGTSKLNNIYQYGGTNYNSNSFTCTLLSSIGLAGSVPAPPRAPGWGTLFVIP